MTNNILEIYNSQLYSQIAELDLSLIHNILLLKIKIIIKDKHNDYNLCNGLLNLDFSFYKDNIDTFSILLENNIQITTEVDEKIFLEITLEYALNNNKMSLLTNLLSKNININYTNERGNTMLMIAARVGSYDIVFELLTRGALIDKQNSVGDTALMHACLNNNIYIAKQMLHYNPNINLVNNSGWSALMYACSNTFDSTEILHYLILKGADKNIKPGGYHSPLQFATLVGNNEIVKYLEKIA